MDGRRIWGFLKAAGELVGIDDNGTYFSQAQTIFTLLALSKRAWCPLCVRRTLQ
jgi:hypothetical protein